MVRDRFDRVPRRGAAGALAAAAILSAFALTGCSVVQKVRQAVHTVEGNRATVEAFESNVRSGEAATFEATYTTTGSAPATIVYAVKPGTGLAFHDTPSVANPSGTGNVEVIVNPSGTYACSATAGTSNWTCDKLGAASAKAQSQIYGFYTPSHWVSFLNDFALGAGLAGDAVSRSTQTVNGFRMQCVDLRAPGVAGTSTICTTSQGILGYVKVASDSTSFEITSYSASPADALFELPPGAKVTTPTT